MTAPLRQYFNDLAPEWHERMPVRPEFLHYLKEFGVSPGERVLDIGAGTGRMTGILQELTGQYGQVVAQDFAEYMLLEAGKRLNRSVLYCCDDVEHLACRSGYFDKVLCFSAFPHFQNPQNAIKEMARVLKTGGRLLVLHTCSSEKLNAFHASLQGLVNTDRLCSAEELSDWFQSAGLSPVKAIDTEDLYWVEGEKL